LQRNYCREAGAIELTVAVGGAETEESQNAKVVFADSRLRVADEAHATLAQVVEASDRIVESPVLAAVEGIDRKIAPRCVFLPNGREGDDGVSSIGFDIAPECRHFERDAVGDDGDGAVVDARRMRAEAGLESEAHDLFRHSRRRDIDFVDGAIDESVANGAADDARFGLSGLESGEYFADRCGMEPGAVDARGSDKGFRHGIMALRVLAAAEARYGRGQFCRLRRRVVRRRPVGCCGTATRT